MYIEKPCPLRNRPYMQKFLQISIDSATQVQEKEETPMTINEDLEDGEIEDDDEEVGESVAQDNADAKTPEAPNAANASPNKFPDKFNHNRNNRFDKPERFNRPEDRKRGHLTEAEKSVLHLHKMERMERLERDKRERYKRDQVNAVDDFASNIEKAIASVLRKDKKGSEEEKNEDDRRGRKRKKKDKEKKKIKHQKLSPKGEDIDENEMLNIRGGSPDHLKCASKDHTRSPTPRSDYESYESSESSDRSKEEKDRRNKRNNRSNNKKDKNSDRKFRDKNRDQKTESQDSSDSYPQSKSNRGNDSLHLQESSNSVKLELCKFYLMECCAKGDKCLYMHSNFPCKYYHTGLQCYAGDSCKFAHGKPLEENLRQILFKHIETAPKEILGDFPRLSRDGALQMIIQTQKALELKYGIEKTLSSGIETAGDKTLIPSLFELNIPVPMELQQKDSDSKPKDKNEKPNRERNRPSRWQDAESATESNQPSGFGIKNLYLDRRDQDMRINSNGDIDMRTLPPPINSLISGLPAKPQIVPAETSDVDIRNETQDTDIRQVNLSQQDTDIRQLPLYTHEDNDNTIDEPNLEIVEDLNDLKSNELPANLPKKQRELFLRIQAQQKENVPDNQKEASDDDRNTDWYSDDDDDDCRLTIRDEIEESKPKNEDEEEEPPEPVQPIKPVEVMEKLGDLSKIDISAEVTKLLSSISQSSTNKERRTPPKDPRLSSVASSDPRRARLEVAEPKPIEKLSIYEQGSISIESISKDVDLRNMEDLDLRGTFGDTDLRANSSQGRPDIDLRQLNLPFKAMQNYTPASEIDASINSHGPMSWKVHLVEIPRPDYTGLKLTPHEAKNTGDPRLRKIFRLNSVEERDSPASPKETSKAPTGIRADPRRRKMEEKALDVAQMNYSQQLNILQTSGFYQSLTSNQKLLLNQELASKSDHSGSNDPTLNGILINLGLVPGASAIVPITNPAANASALNILANVNNMSQMLGQGPGMMPPNQNPLFVNQQINPNILCQNPNIVNQMAQSVVQPGLLGAAPGVPNLPPDFQLNFDPRQGGLLGNAPPFGYNDNSNYNYNEDYYEEGGNFVDPTLGGGGRGGNSGRGNRGGFRDRHQQRRGRNFNNNNNRNANGRNFRNRNRTNRSRTPP